MKPSFVIENRSLKELTWFKAGGVAEFFAAPQNIEDLKSVWYWAWRQKLKIWVLSGGSNVLVQDGVLKGLTLSLHEMKGLLQVDSGERVVIRCLAGTAKSEIAKIFLQNRLPPAVFLTGIPGDMGAGVVMNAGIGEQRTPREFCEIVESIKVLRFDEQAALVTQNIEEIFSLHEISGPDIKWEYRHSSGWQPGLIVEVTVSWLNQPDINVPNEVRAQTKKRISTQPLDMPNCGSVFRNPTGHKSAQLIESCGLKGFRIGGACVSQKHANFIVNDQGAQASDIKKIIEHVQDTVFAQHGVLLVTEVVLVGEF